MNVKWFLFENISAKTFKIFNVNWLTVYGGSFSKSTTYTYWLHPTKETGNTSPSAQAHSQPFQLFSFKCLYLVVGDRTKPPSKAWIS